MYSETELRILDYTVAGFLIEHVLASFATKFLESKVVSLFLGDVVSSIRLARLLLHLIEEISEAAFRDEGLIVQWCLILYFDRHELVKINLELGRGLGLLLLLGSLMLASRCFWLLLIFEVKVEI